MYSLIRNNPDGTTETLLTSTLMTDCIIHQSARTGLNEILKVISYEDDNPDWKQLADGWKIKCVKHLNTLSKISDILAENESHLQWIKDIVQILLDAKIMSINETKQYKL